MFNSESNGYNKSQVDKYIAQLKGELLEYKLNMLESEKKILDTNKRAEELDGKEKSIMKALKVFEDTQKAQEEGSKNIYALKLEQIALIYNKAHSIIKQLWTRHPELKNDGIVKDSIDEFNAMIDDAKKRDGVSMTSTINSENDSMRILLSKMQEARKNQEGPREVKIERANTKIQPSEAFDLQEAVNPKQGLDEIMKAFDFFNDDLK